MKIAHPLLVLMLAVATVAAAPAAMAEPEPAKLAATKAYQFNDLGYTQFIYSEPRVFGGSILYRW